VVRFVGLGMIWVGLGRLEVWKVVGVSCEDEMRTMDGLERARAGLYRLECFVLRI
jgi:hypothetical protein